jgi:hypothetical protein
MIESIIGILLVIAWLVLVIATLIRFGDAGVTDLKAWVMGAVAVWMLAFALNAAAKYEQENPCVTYESRLTYNAATKTMMPMRVCVERGEWVTEGDEE